MAELTKKELKTKIKEQKDKISKKKTLKRIKKLAKLQDKYALLKKPKTVNASIEKPKDTSAKESTIKGYEIMKESIDGLPITTFDGHPLQCLNPKSDKVLASQSNHTLLLFYAYIEPALSSPAHREAVKQAEALAAKHNMTGRLRVAPEGFNGTMTGHTNDTRLFCLSLRSWMKCFEQTDFKLTDDLPFGQIFPALKVFPVNEIVNYGLRGSQPHLNQGGIHLNAKDYHKKMEDQNTVIIDVRNTYEAVIGRFDPPKGF
jgi:hypothetical protein